jgi:hypothetical protein
MPKVATASCRTTGQIPIHLRRQGEAKTNNSMTRNESMLAMELMLQEAERQIDELRRKLRKALSELEETKAEYNAYFRKINNI